MYRFNITQESYKYLKNQCGDINAIEPFSAWKNAYDLKLDALYTRIVPHLPEGCENVLDIGSGLGGIDVLLSLNHEVDVELVDGDTNHEVIKSNIPHSSRAATLDFMADNGVYGCKITTPERFKPSKKDIIISYSAWCFHISPDVYMDKILACCHADTVLFVKVRHNMVDALKPYFSYETLEEKKKARLLCLKPL